ncbi:unnamed protein product [Mytilus edulis]|uniref:Endonuclease/exonuclease/phosphatase domain-containing protein n=1 Tax=Mytilus edulis TaxID=6550 RepID=A0A8S3TMX3_MYTED|nr:unnamed protein product [Mytilus edulis]
MSQLQQQITSFISTAKVDKLSAKNTNEESAFTEKNGDKQNIINPAKRLHSCLSSSSDHSICIENELDEIKQSLKNMRKKADCTEIVTEIFKSLSENLKKQIKKEIMSEVKSEVEKLKNNYDSKISHLHDKLNTIEFENGNLLEKNASLHSDLRKMREVVDENNKKATESVRLGNWNEQYSRKKNVKIYHLPENRNDHEVLIKFLRMDTKISLLRKKKAINEALKVRIGDDITKLNQGLLNRLYQHDNIISSWYFNGHVYGSDEEGTRHRESVDKALDCNLPIFLCGDFNCDMMSNSSNSFKKLLNRLNLENVVWESTNFTTQTGTCIDLCVTNRKNLIKSVTVLTPICSSHSPVSVEISFKTFKQHSFKRQIRDFKRADYEGLKNQLNDTDWDDVVFNSNNINDVYMNFVRTFESTVNRYIPTKTITVRPNDKPFMNNLIRNKIRHRNRIHHKAKTSNNPDHWKKFREIRNEIISLVRKAKDDYKCKLTSQLIDKNIPPGKWWRIAKSVSNFTKNRDSPLFGT